MFRIPPPSMGEGLGGGEGRCSVHQCLRRAVGDPVIATRGTLGTITPTPTRPSRGRKRTGGEGTGRGGREASLDDLVGAGEDRWRDRQAERLGRVEIDDQLECG